MKIIHIVGFKNSGKTTLISRWVRLLKEKGYKVSVLKHHGHASALDMPDENTDGMQFFQDGADMSIVAGAGTAQLLLNEEPDFEQLIQMAAIGKPHVLLVEGFKNEQGNKVVLLRNEEDWNSLQRLPGIQFVIGHTKMTLNADVLERTKESQIDEWFLEWVEEENDEAI